MTEQRTYSMDEFDNAYVVGAEGSLTSFIEMAKEAAVREPEKTMTWLDIVAIVEDIRPRVRSAITTGRTFQALGMDFDQIIDVLGIRPDQVQNIRDAAQEAYDRKYGRPDDVY